MSNTTEKLKYTESHEWIAEDNDNSNITIGITEHAQEQLGEIVYVGLPEVGTQYEPGDTVAVIESVKAASDIYAPVKGEIVEVNETLNENPALVNNSPLEDGWLFRIKVIEDNPNGFLSEEEYKTLTGE